MMSSQGNAKAIRELVMAIFPDMQDQQFEKESEMASFMKDFSEKPFRLLVTKDLRGNMGIALES